MQSIYRAAILFETAGPQPVPRDYSSSLLRALGGIFQIESYYDQAKGPEGCPGSSHHYLRFQEASTRNILDMIIYHITAERPFTYIYNYLSRYPGAVIFCGDYTSNAASRKDSQISEFFAEEMKRTYGNEGEAVLKNLGNRAPPGFHYRKYPLYPEALENARGIITYTEYERHRMIRRFPEKNIIRVPLPYAGAGKKRYERKGRPGRGGSVIMNLGEIKSPQLLDSILDVLSVLKRDGRPVMFILPVKSDTERKRLQAKKNGGLKDILIPVSFRERKKLERFSRRCDFFLKMEEARTLGEWWQLMEALGSGKTVLLADLPEYSDLPDDICVKVRPGRDREAELFSLLSLLVTDDPLRTEIAARAGTFLQQVHHPDRVRKAMGDFFMDLLKEKRKKSGRKPTDVQRIQTETVNSLFDGAISSLGLENLHYLQKELVRMLKWGS